MVRTRRSRNKFQGKEEKEKKSTSIEQEKDRSEGKTENENDNDPVESFKEEENNAEESDDDDDDDKDDDDDNNNNNDNDNDNDTTHNLNDGTKKTRNQRGQRQRQRRILIIKDRIHADIGKKNQTKKHMWLHHEAAQKAAAKFRVDGTLEHTADTNELATATASSSHLLVPTPLYSKGDSIEVKYENTWYSGVITRKPKYKKNDDEFVYSVLYHGDNTTQDDVREVDLQPGEDPIELAVSLGYDREGWTATRKGNGGTQFMITSSDGSIFHSKKAAMKHYLDTADGTTTTDHKKKKGKKRKKRSDDSDDDEDEKAAGDGNNDPPWRKEGHPLVGRKIIWTFQHQASARRQIKIEQIGTIRGYIDETDTDKNGNPGFFSTKMEKADHLFHIVFDTKHNSSYPYSKHYLKCIDLEEYELLDFLLPKEIEPKVVKNKRQKLK